MKKSTVLALLMSFLAFAFITAMAAASFAQFGIPESVTVIGMLALTVTATLTKKAPRIGVFKADIQAEFWVDYIIKKLWKDNVFLQKAYSDDQYVVGGKIVHIPQPGASPTVTKNRSSFPASAVRRTDTDILYSLDEYTTDPTHIQDAEKVELSYDKIDSVLGEHTNSLNQTVADDMIYKWMNGIPGANIITTSGSSFTSNISGQTGTRLAMTHSDLKKARTAMNLANVPQADRYALLEENMLDQMVDSLSTTQYKDFSQYYDAASGTIGKLYGFNIMSRSTVAMTAASLSSGNLVVNALGAATSATDQCASLIWQKDSVTRALGEVKFFEKINDPQYYGDVYSALLRMGGRRRRSDNAGVIVIRQANGA